MSEPSEVFSEEQLQFKAQLARFLDTTSPPSEIRRLMNNAAGFDAGVWQRLCQDLGVAGLHVPESCGGAGFSTVEACIAAEEMGRALYCGPYFSSAIMATTALLQCADNAHSQAYLARLASGDLLGTLVLDNLNSAYFAGESFAVNERVQLSGTAPMVIDAHIAQLLLVVVRTDAGHGLYAVSANAAGVAIEPLETVDTTRRLAAVTLNDAPARWLGEIDVMHLWDELNTVLSCEMVGGASKLFASTIEYLNTRVQFGRTIGSFQGLKHRCADLLMELELARAAAHEAARRMAAGFPASNGVADYSANRAKALASEAYINVAKAAIQLRGGIGFTWEEDTHLWYKRAKGSEVLFGTAHWHREEMIRRLERNHAA